MIRALLTSTDIEHFFYQATALVMLDKADKLLNKRELLFHLNMSESMLYKLLKEGLPKVGNKYRLSDVMQFLANRKTNYKAGPGRPKKISY